MQIDFQSQNLKCSEIQKFSSMKAQVAKSTADLGLQTAPKMGHVVYTSKVEEIELYLGLLLVLRFPSFSLYLFLSPFYYFFI